MQVLPRWQTYLAKIKNTSSDASARTIVADNFPFANFFSDAPQPLFKDEAFDVDMATAELCFRYIENIFIQLEEFRPFELLRSGLDRTRYLLTKEAKIIAMTCTHAGVKRQELVELGFKVSGLANSMLAPLLPSS